MSCYGCWEDSKSPSCLRDQWLWCASRECVRSTDELQRWSGQGGSGVGCLCCSYSGECNAWVPVWALLSLQWLVRAGMDTMRKPVSGGGTCSASPQSSLPGLGALWDLAAAAREGDPLGTKVCWICLLLTLEGNWFCICQVRANETCW